ncbi:MAG: lysylphosphatidylglycerol synthase transmembrane domain-containing protein [Anaerolineae bacterium]
MAGRMRWRRAVKVLLVGVVLFFLGLSIYRGWHGASPFQWNVRPWPLVISFTLALAFWFMTGGGWNLMVRYLGGTLALRKGMKVYFLSNLGWYLPGKVWYAVGRAYLGQQEGVSVGVISTSVLMEMALSLTSSALMATLALPLVSPLLGAKSLYLGVAVLVLGLAVLHPALMKPALTLLERLLPGPKGVLQTSEVSQVDFAQQIAHQSSDFVMEKPSSRPRRSNHEFRRTVPPLRYSVMMGLLVGYLFIWGFVGAAFFVLLNAIYPLPLAWLPTVVAIYAISWSAGFLTPFAPSGLGVREGTMILLLGQYLPVPAVTAAAILFRIWLILAEVIWAAVATRW